MQVLITRWYLMLTGLLSIPVQAQPPNDELQALNDLFGGSVTFKLDRKQQLVIDLYDATGRFRQDIVALNAIDAEAIHFSADEDAIILTCNTGFEKCFSKELFKLNSVRLTGRCNLPRPPEDNGGEWVIAAFRELLLAHRATAQATETQELRPRMK